ncbi:MAG: hypothetical protein ACRDU8_03355 [Egibacteraceae bacterium]
MSDPTAARGMPGPAGQPSPEELREYLEQLRDADAAGLLAEAYNMLAAGAQVKLGRPDARTLIDAMAAMVQATAATLPTELADQMRQGVGQLQMAQVQAERDAGGGPDAQEESGQRPSAEQPEPQQRITDRLWIPGRDSGSPPG